MFNTDPKCKHAVRMPVGFGMLGEPLYGCEDCDAIWIEWLGEWL